MKPRNAAALALLLLASCEPSIKQSTTRAEAAADRTERSATLAEQSADQASKASARVSITAVEANKYGRRADDAMSRLETPTVKRRRLAQRIATDDPRIKEK
jgi:hypothetical protein